MAADPTSGQAAARRYPLTSADLSDAVAVRGVATLVDEQPVDARAGTTPGLFQRRFRLTDLKIIHGKAPAGKAERSLTFVGFTLLAPSQRVSDTRSPSLWLDGQAFFDAALHEGRLEVLLLIGPPEIPPVRGFQGHTAAVEGGAYADQPVRAFLLEGADATLAEAVPALVGWQPKPTLATARAAVAAPHPLIALDALRVASRLAADDQVTLLATWLLHPAQPAGVKALAIGQLGESIKEMPQGSPAADALIGIAVAGWEAERAYQIDAAYLRALQSASAAIKASSRRQQIEAIAADYQVRELVSLSDTLSKQLASGA
jgi:hypothetical protein